MKVGFIGLGTMGAGMANNLQKAGFELVVSDINQQAASRFVSAGATWAPTPKAVAEQSDVVLTSLPGPPEVESVTMGENGLIQGLKPGSAYFDLTTSSPTLIRKIAADMAKKGIFALDAPVSGGPSGANSGQLAVWVGGDKGAFDKFKHVLDGFSDAPFYVGPVGAGSVAKLVHNCMGYIATAGLAEVFTMGVKAGVEPLAIWEAVRQGALGRRGVFERMIDQFLVNKYDPPNFALRLAHKDMTLATNLGREVKVPMRLANMALEEMTEAMNRGWSGRDSRSMMILQQERAGVEIAVDPARIKTILDHDKAKKG
jgi:3-hydroxyisobutyrate dehydrogenase-like beta-hydroxyacid dehydrogenase